jgi:prepilin peptidase CpaA
MYFEAVAMWYSFVIAFMLTAAIADLVWRRIPRQLAIAGFAVGIGVNAYHGQLASALFAALMGFGAGLALFHLRAIGGGDVKLVVALGAMLGWHDWIFSMEIAVIFAGLVAIGTAIYRQRFRRLLTNTAQLAGWIRANGLTPHPEIHVTNNALGHSPFAIAAAIGVLVAVLR